MTERSPFGLFLAANPTIAGAFSELVRVQVEANPLDSRTKHLLNVALQAAHRNATGVRLHAGMARDSGIPLEEVLGAVLMNLHLGGIIPVLDALPAVYEGYGDARD